MPTLEKKDPLALSPSLPRKFLEYFESVSGHGVTDAYQWQTNSHEYTHNFHIIIKIVFWLR